MAFLDVELNATKQENGMFKPMHRVYTKPIGAYQNVPWRSSMENALEESGFVQLWMIGTSIYYLIRSVASNAPDIATTGENDESTDDEDTQQCQENASPTETDDYDPTFYFSEPHDDQQNMQVEEMQLSQRLRLSPKLVCIQNVWQSEYEDRIRGQTPHVC